MKTIISPSVLSIKKEELIEKTKILEANSIEWVHFDVMDGKFVPNIAFSAQDLADLRKHSSLFIDTHLMCVNLFDIVSDYISAGADLITFHYEAIEENKINELIKLIKSTGVKVGISIKPDTEPTVLFKYLKDIDLVLVMSVEPGKGGQSFIENSLNKIELLSKEIDNKHYNCLIEVDGGINNTTAKKCIEKGADVLVSGSYIFNGDIKERIESLR